MKQTAKRILSVVLSMLMLLSALSTISFAGSNYEADDEYYNRIAMDSVVVNADWANLKAGDKVTYVFRGKTIEESFEETTHFSSLSAAYKHCVDINLKSPVIVICPGIYNEDLTIETDVTILGSNAGIDPNVKYEDPMRPWTTSGDRGAETVLRGYIDVSRRVATSITTVLDGLTLHTGFAYIDSSNRTAISNVTLKNSLIVGAGSLSYGAASVTSVFYYASAPNCTNNVTLKNVRASNMKSSSIISTYVTNIDIEGLFYTNSTSPAIFNADANAKQNPEYVIKDSMFYNNNSAMGVLNFNHTQKDSTDRSSTSLDISGCVFMDGDKTKSDELLDSSPIVYNILSVKNQAKIHDCIFKGNVNYNAAPISLVFTTGATSAALYNPVSFTSNKFYGFYNSLDTAGIADISYFDFTGNFYADCDGVRHDPVYRDSYALKNVKMDYYWLDEDLTIPSSIFNVTSTGIQNAKIDNILRTISATVDYGTNIPFNFVPQDASTVYELFADEGLTEKITTINSSDLISGADKNMYFLRATSPKSPETVPVYSLSISTYDPNYAVTLELPNTYFLDQSVSGYPTGTEVFESWNGMSYKCTVGVDVFASSDEIFSVCDAVPTIYMPAGTYTQGIILRKSANVLGAKAGINPSIPQFTDPDKAWLRNPLRSQPDQETIMEHATISISVEAVDAAVSIDGITLGSASGFCDRGEGLTTYTTTTLKNILIDGAGAAPWVDGNKNETLPVPLSFGGASDSYSTNHKDVRLFNIRMEGQSISLLGDYFESILLDGVCMISNSACLFRNEVSASKDQNFYMEIRNSSFYKNITTERYFISNFNTNDSVLRTSNRVVLDNNIFFETSTNAYGIFGIRFSGKKDSIRYTNNSFITGTANAVQPGSSNWFLGKSGIDKGIPDNEVEIISDVYIKHNRFVKCIQPVDMGTNKPGTCWDYSENYFASSYGKGISGRLITLSTVAEAKDKSKCDTYFADWDMTSLVANGTANDSKVTRFESELSFSINGPGVLNTAAKTYTDTVEATTTVYDFGIKMETPQAKYSYYRDAACTIPLSEPVIAGGENTIYIKFSSINGTKSEIYTAKITKPFNNGAEISRVENWRVTEDGVYACVPVGITSFDIPKIEVTPGAVYALYNDAACTSPFIETKITGLIEVPVTKYIKVVSEDTTVTKVYSFNVVQGVNDQAEISYIKNAVKTSPDSFTATITSVDSSFDIVAECSEGASYKVISDGKVIKPIKGVINVDSIITSKTVSLVVTSASGNSKTFNLLIVKDESSCDVTSIFNMYPNGDDLSQFSTKLNSQSFTVIPYLANPLATYAVYSDAQCTELCIGNTVRLTKASTPAYLKITSVDGNKSKIIDLNITTSSFKPQEDPKPTVFKIEGAETVSEDNYYIKAADNLSEYNLQFTMTEAGYAETTYKVFSDPKYSTVLVAESAVTNPARITIRNKLTVLYAVVYVKTGETGLYNKIIKITIDSSRPTVTYNDNAEVSSWAKAQVDYLNNNGFAFFNGDENGNFNPKNSITRFEIAAIAVRLLGIDTSTYAPIELTFKDNIPNWAINYVKACFNLGIMTGVSDDLFNGNAPATRQEFCKIITNCNAILLGEKDASVLYTASKDEVDKAFNAQEFADVSDISSWAIPYIKMAVYNKFISGSRENEKLYIKPKSEITRQEVAIILANSNGYTAD